MPTASESSSTARLRSATTRSSPSSTCGSVTTSHAPSPTRPPGDAVSEAALDPTLRVRQATRIATREIEGRAVVILIDQQRLHTLDEVGTRIFALSDGRTIGAIADAIYDEFDLAHEIALRD